jgi:hypothetical protein
MSEHTVSMEKQLTCKVIVLGQGSREQAADYAERANPGFIATEVDGVQIVGRCESCEKHIFADGNDLNVVCDDIWICEECQKEPT